MWAVSIINFWVNISGWCQQQYYSQSYGCIALLHLSTACVHTALQHLYHENSSKYSGSCCCSPEEFAQFQDSLNVSERLGHFQHRMYYCWCRGMQLRMKRGYFYWCICLVIASGWDSDPDRWEHFHEILKTNWLQYTDALSEFVQSFIRLHQAFVTYCAPPLQSCHKVQSLVMLGSLVTPTTWQVPASGLHSKLGPCRVSHDQQHTVHHRTSTL